MFNSKTISHQIKINLLKSLNLLNAYSEDFLLVHMSLLIGGNCYCSVSARVEVTIRSFIDASNHKQCYLYERNQFYCQNLTTVLLTQSLVGEFSKKITKNGCNFCFSAVTFFLLKIEKSFFLAQIGTWHLHKF